MVYHNIVTDIYCHILRSIKDYEALNLFLVVI